MPQFAIPSATGLMVFARREDLITALLSGLSNQDEGIREEAVKHVLLVYGQTKGMTLAEAHAEVMSLPAESIKILTSAMLRLAHEYNWE
jgi:hypothetical protein